MRHTKAEVLAASARGLPNFDNVRKSAEVLKESMHVQIIVFCIVGILSKTWTNALYVLQIDTKTILVIVVAITKVQQTGTKGRGRVPQWSHQTLL